MKRRKAGVTGRQRPCAGSGRESLRGWNKNNPRRWPVLEAKGDYSFRQLFLNSGCVLLKVDDDGHTVEYYTGGKRPAFVMRSPKR